MGFTENHKGHHHEGMVGVHIRNLRRILIDNPGDLSSVSKTLNFGMENPTHEAEKIARAFVTMACEPFISLYQHDPATTEALLQNPIVVSFFKHGDWIHSPSIRLIASTVKDSIKAKKNNGAQINSIELHSPASCGYHCAFCYKETEPEAKNLYQRARVKGVEMVAEDFWHQTVLAILASRGEETNHTVPFVVLQSGCSDSEPTLAPFFGDFLRNNRRYVTNRFGEEVAKLVKHDVYTIGITLANPQTRQALLQTDQVRVSLFSPDPNEYATISQLNSIVYHRVVKGLKALVDERNQQGSKTKISTSYIAIPDNYRSFERMLELCGEIGIDFLDLRSLHGETIENLSPEQKAEYTQALRDIYAKKEQYHFQINFGYTPAALVLGFDAQEISTLDPTTLNINMLNRSYAAPRKLTLTQGGVLLGFSPGVEAGNFIPDEILDSPFAVGKLDIQDIEQWPLLMKALSEGNAARANNSAVRTLQTIDPSNPQNRERVRRITTGSILVYKILEAISGQTVEQIESHPYTHLFASTQR